MRKLVAFFLCGATAFFPGLATAAENEHGQEVWIDVRSPQEYRQGHVVGAVNLPHGEIAHRIADHVRDPYTRIHLYCATGTYAGMALEILMELGFQDVVNEGAYEAILARMPQ